jgi:hypothetical protein
VSADQLTAGEGLVTDGTSFWVVDGSELKVFKYTLSGSPLGSWGIDPANTHPTGITINPNNVSDIWIVDNGTLKVYQYIGAAGRTSGSQNAAATFALAPGDTNPQGIADPPPANMLVTVADPVAVSEPSVKSLHTATAHKLATHGISDFFATLAKHEQDRIPTDLAVVSPSSPAIAGPATATTVSSQGFQPPKTSTIAYFERFARSHKPADGSDMFSPLA